MHRKETIGQLSQIVIALLCCAACQQPPVDPSSWCWLLAHGRSVARRLWCIMDIF